MIRAIVQARMTSRRFPGKMLAPFGGVPLLGRVIERVRAAFPLDRIVVATSNERADDPLALYASAALGTDVFRGSLDDVFGRFQRCLEERPCDWFFRVCADSPLLDSSMFGRLSRLVDDQLDVITNVQKRTFPRGQSFELIRTSTFLAIDPSALDAHQREHVTRFFYDNPARFRILNVESGDPSLRETSVCVDSLEDLRRLESSHTHHDD